MSCEDRIETKTTIAVAANKLTEARKTNPGSIDHETAMASLLSHLNQPGALDVLKDVIKMVK